MSRWIIGTITFIVILLLVATALLLGPLGLKLGLSIFKGRIDGTLTYSEASGNLLGPYTFKNVAYNDGTTKFYAKRLYFSWKKLNFSKPDIEIIDFELDNSTLTTNTKLSTWLRAKFSKKPEQVKSSKTLTDDNKKQQWTPPWLHSRILIKKLQVEDFTLKNEQNKTAWHIQSIDGNSDISESKLISNLNINMDKPNNSQIIWQSRGKPNNYTGTLKITGPKTNWNVALKGDEKQSNFHTAHSELWGGQLAAKANVDWSHGFTWSTFWDINNINPSMIWKKNRTPFKIPQSISLKLQSNGNPQKATVNWHDLSVRDNKEYLTGYGSLQFINEKLKDIIVYLKSDKNLLKINGNYNKRWKVQWYANIKNLQDFFEYAYGSVAAKGSIVGSRQNPELNGQFNATDLRYKEEGFHTIAADWDISSSAHHPATITATASGAMKKNQPWQSLQLSAKGFLNNHKIVFSGTAPNMKWNMNLIGKYINGNWNAKLEKWYVSSNDGHKWWLKQPSSLTWTSNNFIIQPMCLINKYSNLCVNGTWEGMQKSSLDLTAKQWPLSVFKPWMWRTKSIKGQISGFSHIEIYNHELKQWNNQWKINNIRWRVRLDDNSLLPVIIPTTTIDSTLDSGSLNIKFIGTSRKQGSWNIKLGMPGYNKISTPKPNQPITGTANITLSDLHQFQPLIPAISNFYGSLQSNLKLSGTWGKPLLYGSVKIPDGRFTIPKYGITLNKINGVVNANGQKFGINLKAYSAGKPFLYHGTGSFTTKSFHTQGMLTGNDVLACQTDKYTFYATPDLKIQMDNKDINVTGKVLIPTGSIHPKNFDTASSLSDDTIIIKDSKHANEKPFTVSSKITLIAGKDLDIDASGIKGTVNGSITVTSRNKQISTAVGELYLTKGTYETQGHELTLTKGVFSFHQSPLDNPFLDVGAERLIRSAYSTAGSSTNNLTVGVLINGTLRSPKTSFYSSPVTLSQSDILSYLVFGQGSESSASGSMALLSQTLSSFSFGKSDSNKQSIVQSVKKGLNFDEFGFEPQARVDPLGTPLQSDNSFVLGRHLGKRLYLRYSSGASASAFGKGYEMELRYTITPRWSVQVSSGTISDREGIDILYTIDRK